ncbi:MAG TPA: propionate/acetate kinase, partial [Verrucomicrobiales bacterium]|nr:propionate/acetate kinase [Verrucomicrobiales bacterium]
MILVINSGSSTVKFAAYGTPALEPLLSGMAESLRTASASLKLKSQEGPAVIAIAEADHHQALDIIAAELLRRIPSCEIEAVGHRVVHGGGFFRQ